MHARKKNKNYKPKGHITVHVQIAIIFSEEKKKIIKISSKITVITSNPNPRITEVQ